MRVSIIKKDGFVSVDGVGFGGLDLSFLPDTVHAIQWYGDFGEVEMYEPHPYKIMMAPSKNISSFDEYKPCLDAWAAAKVRYEEAQAAKIAAHNAELARMAAQQTPA